MQIPDHLRSDDDSTVYTLDVEGNVYGKLYGSLFQHKSKISLKRPNVKVLLQTEQLIYKQGQTGGSKENGFPRMLVRFKAKFLFSWSAFILTELGVRELREVRLCKTWSNRVGCFDSYQLSCIPPKQPVPNRSNRWSMMQPYLA